MYFFYKCLNNENCCNPELKLKQIKYIFYIKNHCSLKKIDLLRFTLHQATTIFTKIFLLDHLRIFPFSNRKITCCDETTFHKCDVPSKRFLQIKSSLSETIIDTTVVHVDL